MSATISRMRSHVLARFSAAPEPAKKYVQPHTAGLSTCAFSFPTSAPGQPNPTLPSSASLRARFRRRATRFSGTVSKKHGNAPELASQPRCLIWNARCRRFAPSPFSGGKLRVAAPKVTTTRGYPWSDEVDTFWDWALLELLVQSGLRIEEASELTTLDILKRKMPDGRIYYLLHIKPSKFDRARVIPIGDGLGRVLAEIIRYVKRFYNSESVPVCDHWDLQEKRPRPPAPYLIQGIRHPSTAGIQTIRSRIREISIDAEARRSDGSPLVLLPHDCRRVFASEHLNNNTPVHIIQALLGHASPDTVMIYAKLYPSQLIEEYRKTVRSLYNAYYGEDGLKNPTAEEWAAFAASCNLRDMGTHLCALPTGEHCPKGLICLGCAHAQPKKSAVPIFRRMLASHERSLVAARGHSEPAGQIAAREMEIVRIKGALQRAEELSDDVAAAIERAL